MPGWRAVPGWLVSLVGTGVGMGACIGNLQAIGTRVLTFWGPADSPESAALPREVPGARLWLDGLEASKQPGRRALLYSDDAPGSLGNISVPSGATHVIFCGLVPGAHYRVDIASSTGDISQSISGYTSECQHSNLLGLGLEGRWNEGGIQESWAEGITGPQHGPLPNCPLFRSPATAVTGGHQQEQPI